jgi:sugar fermentation stimulation protein A
MPGITFDLPRPLLRGTLLRRYQRFLADVRLEDGKVITAHCPNSGTMRTCSDPGSPALVSASTNPRRRLAHTLELVWGGESWVGVNTMTPNRVVAAAVAADALPPLAGYPRLRREVRYGDGGRSRVDLLLEDPSGRRPDAYVEVKNTTLRDGAFAEFPDAVTDRGRKHLEDLEGVVAAGYRGVILFFVGRSDCARFRPADPVDPAYGAALRRAAAAGVEVLAWGFAFEPPVVRPLDLLPVELARR